MSKKTEFFELLKKRNNYDKIKQKLDDDANKKLFHQGEIQLIHAIEKKSGNTALHIACKEGKQEYAELLIKYGAYKNIKNIDGKTPLELAKEDKKEELNKVFEEATEETDKEAVKNTWSDWLKTLVIYPSSIKTEEKVETESNETGNENPYAQAEQENTETTARARAGKDENSYAQTKQEEPEITARARAGTVSSGPTSGKTSELENEVKKFVTLSAASVANTTSTKPQVTERTVNSCSTGQATAKTIVYPSNEENPLGEGDKKGWWQSITSVFSRKETEIGGETREPELQEHPRGKSETSDNSEARAPEEEKEYLESAKITPPKEALGSDNVNGVEAAGEDA